MSDDLGMTTAPEEPLAGPLESSERPPYDSEAGGADGHPTDPDLLMGRDRTPQRATVYWVLLLVLAAGPFLLRDSPWRSGPSLHTVIETASTVLAFMAGALALVRFYSKKRSTYLFIGTGFLGTAILEAYHASVSSGFFAGQNLLQLVDVTAWSWIGARLFLALFLFVSWLSWRRADWAGGAEGEEEGSIYLTTILLTALILGFVAFVPTRPAYYPDLFIHRPADLLPGMFFVLALGGYLWKGAWRRDPFEHWLVIALLVSAIAQIGYMPFSLQPNDWAYDAAHLLKIVSYGAVLTGILISVYVTFRREERALEQIQSANDALAREVAVRRKAERILQESEERLRDFLDNANDALGREVAVRRKAERILQDSEERLRDFLDNANDLIQSTAPDGEIQYVNRAWVRTLGYSEEEATGRSMWDFVHPSSRAEAREAFEAVLEGEPVAGVEVEFVASDGRVVICSGSSNCRFENGVPVTVRSIFRDVTEQRRVEREMAAARANVEALVESTGDTIWSVDQKHRLIEFNTAFALSQEARTGREPHKGDHPAQVFRPDEVAWYRDQYDQALSGERFSVLRTEEFQGQTKNYEYFFNPIVEDRGIAGVVAFGRDVTRRILAEEALRLAKEEAEAANRAKTQFLANMSHELRTPLNSVIGFTNILLKNQGGNLEDKQITFLERVLSNGRHLLTLINEVLDLAKVESGRMELELEEVSLEKLVRETLGQLEGQVRASKGDKVHLRPEIPERTALLETDRAKLKQVIINLVGNALRFTDEGEVAVIVESAADGLPRAIHVRDTGIGIPQDRLDAIFEAFQQADSSTSRKYGGTGLGLTISRSICQMLGYELDVSSEVGEGSTFTIRLQPSATGRHEEAVTDAGPKAGDEEEVEVAASSDGKRSRASGVAGADGVDGDSEAGKGGRPGRVKKGRRKGARARDAGSEDAGAPAVDRHPVTSAARGFKVLVIDDEHDSRVLMKHFLQDFGCEVVTAETAQKGLALARSHRPDLIALDLMMPGTDGFEVLRTLKDDPELREIPVVVVSIVASENRGSLLGAVDLIDKPVEREDLLRVLWRNLLRRQGGRVLLVENEDEVRELYAEYLEGAGLEVVTAENGAEALQMLSRESPDAIIVDLVMPVMDGFTFLQKLRDIPEYVGIPAIVITGEELEGAEREEISRQVSGIIQKDVEDVEDRLRDYLGTIFPLKNQEA